MNAGAQSTQTAAPYACWASEKPPLSTGSGKRGGRERKIDEIAGRHGQVVVNSVDKPPTG